MQPGEVDSMMRDFRERVRSGQTFPVVQKAFGAKPLVGHKVLSFTDGAPILPPEQTRPPYGKAKTQRVEDFLRDVARTVVLQVHQKPKRGDVSHDDLIKAFEVAIDRKRVAIADGVSNDHVKLRAAVEQERQQWVDDRLARRKALALEFRTARATLRAIQRRSGRLEQEEKQALARLLSENDRYPAVPTSKVRPHKDGVGLPDTPGIYFLWKGNIIDYVGKSIRLSGRVKLGSHHVLQPGHEVSFVEIPERELTWAECHYIGLLKPLANFGAAASHRRTE